MIDNYLDNKSIVIIGTYFGPLPKYMKYWLISCAYNPTIQFYVYTDQIIENPPDNVKIINTALHELSKVMSNKLGVNVSIHNPYKLCDMKPMYGTIFNEDIKEFDYWGHCDFDLVWGNLRKFLSDEILENHDRILDLGHLTIYKNTKEVTCRFKLENSNINYRSALETPNHVAFDEIAMNKIYSEYSFSQYINREIIADIRPYYKRLSISKDIDKKNQIFYWENGHIYRSYLTSSNDCVTDEFMYIHFQKRRFRLFDELKESHKGFLITNMGFINKDEININKRLIYKYNRYQGVVLETFQKSIFMLKHIYKTSKKVKTIREFFNL